MKLKCLFVCASVISCSLLGGVVSFTFKAEPQKPRVCVIGAGIAGLTSAHYLKEEGLNFTVLEATQYVGGTWRYDPRVGTDEFGQPIHTSMYKHLRTNLPKQAMELSGFPIPKEYPSFPSWKLFYEYLKSYAKHFQLEEHIKFSHLVESVKRVENAWKVKHKNVKTGEQFEEVCDFIFIATGHHSKPNMPNIPGEELFKGTIIHSHDFREPDPYKGRRVMIVGSGPSGMDIGLDVADVSKTLFHSTHSKVTFRTPFPDNFIKKPDVKRFTENGAYFSDGSFEELDDVIYCTGFQYSYPFLDESSGLTFAPRYVIPLYHYMVNINQPTMIMMGMVVRACLVAAIDAQARYATALAKGNFSLPSKEEMLAEWQTRADLVKSRGRPMSDIHLLAEREDEYYAAIAKESGTSRVPPVLFKMRTLDTAAKLDNLYTYRNYVYNVIDENTFTRCYQDPRESKSCTP